jgi:hypothetical protein
MIAATRSIAFTAAAVLTLHSTPAAASDKTQFIFTALLPPGGGSTSVYPVGVYQDQAIGYFITENAVREGFAWSAGSYTLLPALGVVRGVSSSGVAVGDTPGSDTSYTTYNIRTGATNVVNFSPPGGNSFHVGSINSSGTVIASQNVIKMKNEPKIVCQPFEQDASGSYSWLGNASVHGMNPVGLTDDGIFVLGDSQRCTIYQSYKFFIYKDNRAKKFLVPGSKATGIYFVSGSGFGGEYYNAHSRQVFGFTATGTKLKLTTYATSPSNLSMCITAIGPRNEVAGYTLDKLGYYHGFIYKSGIYHEINYPGQSSTILTGFSSTGAIIGDFADFNDTHGLPNQAFIATCASDKGCTK